MVRGLAVFQEWFKDFESHYVLIGGTAASITMNEAGLPFRGTKDLDIVLHVEVLTPAFGRQFWEFVQAGGYQKKRPTLRENCVCTDFKNLSMMNFRICWNCSHACRKV
jgi:hypothetical protein